MEFCQGLNLNAALATCSPTTRGRICTSKLSYIFLSLKISSPLIDMHAVYVIIKWVTT